MSINAELVAKEVIKKVAKGGKINMAEIIRDKGYSEAVAHTPQKVTEQPAYKAIMIPALQRMEKIRDKVLKALDNKDMNLEDSRVLKELLDSTTKNIQLLSGKATENVSSTINIVRYDERPLELSVSVKDSPLESAPQIESDVKESISVLVHDDEPAGDPAIDKLD